ncbi:hypothetical protein [Curtobacterium sp. VKM Ac-1393]|uniref:hypothetical protein n=1 Tax=Curtobacterium sp. VKM Ac-1393 TaxID=2783814 RepID=UPI001889C9EE|nr:hypothetical protein [Curtobacterium sp. VKM Ac-1393]MBF4608927.1 hypothetical protein [Curtobacterium sp. VKM Ac-1393]
MTTEPTPEYERLRAALARLSDAPDETLHDLAAMLELMAEPSRLAPMTRYLALEWLGACDSSALDNRQLRHRDLLAVICRMTAIDVVTDLNVDDCARLLNVGRPQLVQLINDGRVWTYNAGRGPRVPTWQLVRDSSEDPIRLLGGPLSAVVAAIPDSASPSLVRRLMTTESSALKDAAGRETTPAEWIAQGNSPWPVMAILLRFLTGNSDYATPLLFTRRLAG